MTLKTIRAVLFDMGGTLEDVYYDDEMRLKATPGLRDIMQRHGIDPGLPVPDLYRVVQTGMKKYMDWRERSEQELPPERVWPEYIFPNRVFPRERLEAIAEELAFYYDTHFYVRTLRPEVPDLLHVLHDRGLRLGVISNIYSREQVPFNLESYGLDHYFQTVVMSACVGWRKPNPRIFHEATQLMHLPPEVCAYVGDTVSRDIAGARRAGYALAIQIKSFLTTQSDRPTDTEAPDAVVDNLMQVVDLVTPNSQEIVGR